MSSIWKKCTYSQRQLDNHWMNILYGTHDLFCHCEDPALHFMYVINKNSNAPKPLKDLENLKCLLTGKDTAATPEEEDIGIGPGDLEKLFGEDTEPTEPAER